MKRRLLALLALLLGAGAAQADIGWEIERTLPHDPAAFTQGLFIADGLLYESTGLVGRSELRAMRLDDMKVLRSKPLRADLFGEGSAPWRDRIVSLTWRSGIGFIWRRKDFRQLRTFTYAGEGWGLTSDAHGLIMSDGTAELRFLDPETLKETGRVKVTDDGMEIVNINEIEWIEGEVWANIWQTDWIARIDPATGHVKGWIDMTGLLPDIDRTGGEDVLNGIAYDAGKKRVLVTGKFWPRLYEIRVKP